MKKALAAFSAVLFLLCIACGCGKNDAADSNDSAAVTERAATPVGEAASDLRTGSQSTTVRSDAAWSTTIPRTTTAPETTEAPQEQTQDASDSADVEPTSGTTVQSADAQTQTTHQSLVEQWRALRSRPRSLKPSPTFFNDVVFVGDSVTLGLRNYTTSQRNDGKDCLGSAQFLCSGSMGYTNALEKVNGKSMHPTYKGDKVTIEDGVKMCGAKKVFIMLGMNDFSAYDEKVWKESVGTLIDKILEKTPNAAIVVQSVTPILSGKEHGRFTNDKIRAYNDYLQQVCKDRGFTYLDIYEILADDTGHLKKEYCGDPGAMGIHLAYEGCAAWIEYLQTTFCGA